MSSYDLFARKCCQTLLAERGLQVAQLPPTVFLRTKLCAGVVYHANLMEQKHIHSVMCTERQSQRRPTSKQSKHCRLICKNTSWVEVSQH